MNKQERPDNIIQFNGGSKNRYENKYGFDSLTQVKEQLDVQEQEGDQKVSYSKALSELKAGDLKNIELINETRKILLDLRTIATGLSTGSAEDIAIVEAVNKRLAEIDEAKKEVEVKKSKFA